MDFQGFTYVAGDSAVHRCDAWAKIVGLFAFSVAIFFVRSWWGMVAFAAAVVALVALARIPVRRMVAPLAPVTVFAALAVAFAVAGDPTVEGLLGGLLTGSRMVVLVAASLVVCLTTSSTALLAAFAKIISPLGALGVPVGDVGLTLSLALRFIPVIADEFAAVRMAQVARGASLEGMSLRRKLQVWGAAFSAVFIGLFRRADALACALDSRCYGFRGGQRADDADSSGEGENEPTDFLR